MNVARCQRCKSDVYWYYTYSGWCRCDELTRVALIWSQRRWSYDVLLNEKDPSRYLVNSSSFFWMRALKSLISPSAFVYTSLNPPLLKFYEKFPISISPLYDLLWILSPNITYTYSVVFSRATPINGTVIRTERSHCGCSILLLQFIYPFYVSCIVHGILHF